MVLVSNNIYFKQQIINILRCTMLINSDTIQYYNILEVSPESSIEEIKQAYHELCIIWHPDRHPDRVKDRATKK